MIKYASNAFLATKISFINAIANLCEAVDADVREVALGMGYDRRIGFEFLHPGPGFGGSCFPKDTAALLYTAAEPGYDFDLLEGVRRGEPEPARAHGREDRARGRRLARRSGDRRAGASRSRPTPTTCAIRRRCVIAQRLLDAGAMVRAYDPAAGERGGGSMLPGLDVRQDPYEAAQGAQVLAVLTEWDEFRWLDFDRVTTLDGRARDRRRPQPARPRGDAPARASQYVGVGR